MNCTKLHEDAPVLILDRVIRSVGSVAVWWRDSLFCDDKLMHYVLMSSHRWRGDVWLVEFDWLVVLHVWPFKSCRLYFCQFPESAWKFDFQAAGLSSGTVNLHRHKSIWDDSQTRARSLSTCSLRRGAFRCTLFQSGKTQKTKLEWPERQSFYFSLINTNQHPSSFCLCSFYRFRCWNLKNSFSTMFNVTL